MTTSGLLSAGQLVPVDSLTVIPPASHGGPAWSALDPGDYRARKTTWIRQVIIHATKGLHPQRVIPGAGHAGRAATVADFWRGDRAHSAAHLVVDLDGTVACLADLARVEAFHAEASNPWSIGIEMYQLGDGGLYEATLDATVRLVQALCRHMGIPEQIPIGPYAGTPLLRMRDGGSDLCGVFGHRDNTIRRGRGDPGDAIMERLAGRGFEALDFDRRQDLALGKGRQIRLNELDAKAGLTWRPLAIDGVCGGASIAAMRRHGFERWRDVI